MTVNRQQPAPLSAPQPTAPASSAMRVAMERQIQENNFETNLTRDEVAHPYDPATTNIKDGNLSVRQAAVVINELTESGFKQDAGEIAAAAIKVDPSSNPDNPSSADLYWQNVAENSLEAIQGNLATDGTEDLDDAENGLSMSVLDHLSTLSASDMRDIAERSPAVLASIGGSLSSTLQGILGLTGKLDKTIGTVAEVLKELEPEHPGRAILQDFMKNLKDAKQSSLASGAHVSNRQALDAQTNVVRTADGKIDGAQTGQGTQASAPALSPTQAAIVNLMGLGAAEMQLRGGLTHMPEQKIIDDFSNVPGLWERALQGVKPPAGSPEYTVRSQFLQDHKIEPDDPVALESPRSTFVSGMQRILEQEANAPAPQPVGPAPGLSYGQNLNPARA